MLPVRGARSEVEEGSSGSTSVLDVVSLMGVGLMSVEE